ncbi:MAG: trehalose phosphatase [Oceanospirillales bacterium]|uniref:Hydroxymethylpyrimidine pyrophosphatase-like HAD family hydrolase n=1 Tax=Marinobacterium halophilum TaxID=267374 RepID=A0A2P8EYL6_9GAMM|nr:trehalose phosphatase [Marinobacterium halophilum]MBR9828597.1 trehalose phosphatase [Oceanospirillales bacterium]PSL14569.1 hypothetical protein CLV44_10720 [Marinobacterium halophilum]
MQAERPLVFVDLDDTLFQTARKMLQGASRYTATLDAEGQPNGYMSSVQKMFADWLLASADVVPVTARSTDVYRRVVLPFTQGAVCSHGGIILRADGTPDQDWAMQMAATLEPLQERLHALTVHILEAGEMIGVSLRTWVVEEAGIGQYVVAKHNGAGDAVLGDVLAVIKAKGLVAGMHVHRNGNNLALLPVGLEKKHAVQEWLRRDREIHGERPVLGMGDSITDLGFMQSCDLWATPSGSQLAALVEDNSHD